MLTELWEVETGRRNRTRGGIYFDRYSGENIPFWADDRVPTSEIWIISTGRIDLDREVATVPLIPIEELRQEEEASDADRILARLWNAYDPAKLERSVTEALNKIASRHGLRTKLRLAGYVVVKAETTAEELAADLWRSAVDFVSRWQSG